MPLKVKRKEKTDHKYVAKIKTKSNKTRYFYTKEEYKTYLDNLKSTKDTVVSNLKNKANGIATTLNKTSDNVSANAKEKLTTIISKGKQQTEKTLEKIADKTVDFKYVAKVKISPTYTRYFYDKKSYDAYLKGIEGLTSTTNSDIAVGYTEYSVKSTESAASKGSMILAFMFGGLAGLKLYDKRQDRKRKEEEEEERKRNEEEERKRNEEEERKRNEEEERKRKEMIRKASRPSLTTMSEMKLKSPSDSTDPDEDMELVNPYYKQDFGDGGYAYTYNCAYCTTAYELRRRGYDVEAVGVDSDDSYRIGTYHETMYDPPEPKNLLEKIKGTEQRKFAYYSNMRDTETVLLTYPDGSYGRYNMIWVTGGGHAMFWEKVDGTIILRDAQTNTKYTYDEFVISRNEYIKYTGYMRTDDLTINDNAMVHVRNREE